MNKKVNKLLVTFTTVSLMITGVIMQQISNVDALESITVEQKTKVVEKIDAQKLIVKENYEDTVIQKAVGKTDIQEPEVPNLSELPIEEHIKWVCGKYDIPYDITLAIARLETGWFKSYAYRVKNNPGGMSRNEVPMQFDTIEEGVEYFVRNLANNYFAIGLDTPEKIGQKYCPCNPNWARIVNDLMEMGI